MGRPRSADDSAFVGVVGPAAESAAHESADSVAANRAAVVHKRYSFRARFHFTSMAFAFSRRTNVRVFPSTLHFYGEQ